MCGIAGTVYRKGTISGEKLSANEFLLAVKSFGKDLNSEGLILDQAWLFKNDVNFIKFCLDKVYADKINEINQTLSGKIKKFQKSIDEIDKVKETDKYLEKLKILQTLRDAEWFLDVEAKRWIQDIEYLSSKKITDITPENIIFFKDLVSIIRSIDNKLELRGRDAFGLTIQVRVKDRSILDSIDCKRKFYNKNSRTETIKNFNNIVSFSFKTFNRVGSLGENANYLKLMIKETDSLNKLVSNGGINSAIIVGHTRWASVGPVNIQNTHPIFAYKDKSSWSAGLLNGDIYNYLDLVKDPDIFLENDCKTDCSVVASHLFDSSRNGFLTLKEKVNDFEGSFALVHFDSQSNDLNVFKKGAQGLYIGLNGRKIIFASDVYGLIEFCRYFHPINSGESFQLTEIVNEKHDLLSVHKGLLDNEEIQISQKDFRETIITTRDIDKKGFEYYLEKEIFDTSDIIESTVNRYVQVRRERGKVQASFAISESQIPNIIIKAFDNGTIKKIIVTGMGTCYTAAVAISRYMRELLKFKDPNIIVEPHVASEGSGFYLEANMSDVLVVVIAQSGTTIDTNIYAKMAKERGALSLAIANKREGDITFIVDGTLYLGEGRDIEISVPSTKTYTAQIIVGYILTLFFLSKSTNKKLLKDRVVSEAELLLKCGERAKKILNNISRKDYFEFSPSILQKTSWVVAFDESENSVCSPEIRIKFSETCYKAIPYIDLSELQEFNLSDSLITVITLQSISKLKKILADLVARNNTIILVTEANSRKVPKELNYQIKSKSIMVFHLPKSPEHFSFLPTILVGQMLSLNLAMFLNSRAFEFFALNSNKIENHDFKKSIIRRITKALNSGDYNIGIDKKRIEQLIKKENNNLKFKSHEIAISLADEARRTIDTIKHQAKTITVGALRSPLVQIDNSFGAYDTQQTDTKIFIKPFEKILSNFDVADFKLLGAIKSPNIYLSSEIDQCYLYNIINIVDEFSKKFEVRNPLKLAQKYDIQEAEKNKTRVVLYLNFGKVRKISTKGRIVLNFSDFKGKSETSTLFKLSTFEHLKFPEFMWTFCISFLLVEQFLIKKMAVNLQQLAYEKVDLQLEKNLNSLNNAKKTLGYYERKENTMESCAPIFLNNQNSKCVGSGVNYNFAKYSAKILMKKFEKAIAFDVLENHKHIDISAESTILIFIANIERAGYQADAFAEVQKMISHRNFPIIVTIENDTRFDNMLYHDEKNMKEYRIAVIKVPRVDEEFSFFLNLFVLDNFITHLKLRA